VNDAGTARRGSLQTIRERDLVAPEDRVDQSVEVRNEKVLGGVSAHRLQRTLKGHIFESTRRHGKYLFVELDGGGWMLMHFGMTGSLAYFKSPDEELPHSRLLFAVEPGYHLAFDCQRMFGKVDLVEGPEDFAREKEFGPDPLQLDADSFRERYEGRKGDVKAALLNRKVLAGIGNIYSDEILFQAQLYPRASVARFDDPSLGKLHKEVRRVLKMAIEREANWQKLPNPFLLSYRRERERYPRGTGKIQKTNAAGRTSYYCPACQPKAR
jgi:formamidopyrimidine-DNA glycosylase